MKTIRPFLVTMIATIAITTSSCSKSDDNTDSSSNSCNDIVCGGKNPDGKYYIYRGTLNPDTCGETELLVNEKTFKYYQSKWQANPKGYACWEGLK